MLTQVLVVLGLVVLFIVSVALGIRFHPRLRLPKTPATPEQRAAFYADILAGLTDARKRMTLMREALGAAEASPDRKGLFSGDPPLMDAFPTAAFASGEVQELLAAAVKQQLQVSRALIRRDQAALQREAAAAALAYDRLESQVRAELGASSRPTGPD